MAFSLSASVMLPVVLVTRLALNPVGVSSPNMALPCGSLAEVMAYQAVSLVVG